MKLTKNIVNLLLIPNLFCANTIIAMQQPKDIEYLTVVLKNKTNKALQVTGKNGFAIAFGKHAEHRVQVPLPLFSSGMTDYYENIFEIKEPCPLKSVLAKLTIGKNELNSTEHRLMLFLTSNNRTVYKRLAVMVAGNIINTAECHVRLQGNSLEESEVEILVPGATLYDDEYLPEKIWRK